MKTSPLLIKIKDYCILNSYFKPLTFSMVMNIFSLHLKAYKCRNCSLKLKLQQFYILARYLMTTGIANYVGIFAILQNKCTHKLSVGLCYLIPTEAWLWDANYDCCFWILSSVTRTCESHVSRSNATSRIPSRGIKSKKRWWPVHLGGALVQSWCSLEAVRYEVVGYTAAGWGGC